MDEPINKSERAKRNLLRTVRRQRLKYISILPSLVTLLNGVFGFAAIVFAAKAGRPDALGLGVSSHHFPYFSMACYMIFFAMIADMLDGHLARLSQSTSSFGGQLDSLCDAISFGVAPAFLMLRVVENRAAFDNPVFDVFVYRFLWLSAVIYFSCAAIRLARFNVENEEDEASHMSFSGLPTPAAAGVVTSLILLNQDIVKNFGIGNTIFAQIEYNIIIAVLPFVTLAIAVLMVSRIRYPHIINQYLRGRKPFAYLLWSIAIVVMIIYCFEIALAFVFCTFAASGFFKWFHSRFIAHKTAPGQPEEPPVITISH
ncbi:MAG: phosphatidylcholine/phosphatidylserine synthase [Planctomycetes bacterium]|nr:phosphatidylcholine/phosphatidylserine synthase [Planctomycetota bacterium]MBU1518624.1 phosphatidylcholine/phosphatidylserine synthase [Planctomycetota bacterium]MBU2457710.1 phosphatidylcholine/phosphatidylserine synthase [Planctomycetota bacterium]MBU2596771.1 phosphatidylcholine/phosphatidylserine synthase [Planctomycetota bacterium]